LRAALNAPRRQSADNYAAGVAGSVTGAIVGSSVAGAAGVVPSSLYIVFNKNLDFSPKMGGFGAKISISVF
jgi:hypothetical protein